MSAQKLGNAFALKTEAESINELRQFFKDRKIPAVEFPGPANVFENVTELLRFASQLVGSLNEKDLELILNAVFNLSVTFEPAETVAFVETLCKTLKTDAFAGKSWNSPAGVAVRTLSNVFHMYTDRPGIQLTAFTTLVEIAGKAKITRFADISLDTVSRHAADWKLTVEEKRALLRVLHGALLNDGRVDAAADVMTDLLKTYTDVDADKAKEDARQCVRTAVVDPKNFSVDHLLRLSAVRRLQQTDPKIYKMLVLFSNGLLSDFQAFIKENPGFVKQELGVEETVLEKKMKMLSLISLAEKSPVLCLDSLSKQLQIPSGEDLEEFLIDAIRIKAVNGKINEQKKEFVVTTFQHRTFDRPQWDLLQKRLSSLLKNLKKTHDNVTSLADVEN